MDVRRGKEGQCFPCNFCSQWGFGGNFGFSSTTNNNPVSCASFGFSGRAIFILLDSICVIEAECKRAFYSVDFLSQRPELSLWSATICCWENTRERA